MKSEREVEGGAREEFDNSFDVPLPSSRSLAAPRGHPAELTEAVDDRTYKGKLSVPLRR